MDLNFKYDREYLYRQHSFDKVKRWVNSLNSFYFIRAFGGHANDADLFETRIKYTDKNELEIILRSLGISGLSESEYFGHRIINNNEWFVTIDFKRKAIDFIKGTNYDVTDKDFEATLDLDKLFEKLGLNDKVERDIIYNPCCISRERYNELWD